MMIKTPANDITTAIQHHTKHGDMDGRICLLNACALHYPQKDHRAFSVRFRLSSEVVMRLINQDPEVLRSVAQYTRTEILNTLYVHNPYPGDLGDKVAQALEHVQFQKTNNLDQILAKLDS